MNEVIVINNLWKQYTLGQAKKLTEALPLWWKGAQAKNFWALKNINLRVKAGEKLGIIGPNGSGKSTLLKILAGITYPSRGQVKIRGKVASLLELGTGFHPDLTGRENIYLSAAILGITKAEITRRFTEIVNFASINKFIDTPVKHYSSGMYLRLAFSIATTLSSEILLLDEVFAVGDLDFQRKSLARIKQLISSNVQKTLVFVSHDLTHIQEVCDRVIFLEKGKIVKEGQPQKIIQKYKEKVNKKAPPIPIGFARLTRFNRTRGTQELTFQKVYVTGNINPHVTIVLRVNTQITGILLGVLLRNENGDCVFTSTDWDTAQNPTKLPSQVYKSGIYQASFTIPHKFLRLGKYYLDLVATVPYRRILDECQRAVGLEVAGNPVKDEIIGGRQGVVSPFLSWKKRSI